MQTGRDGARERSSHNGWPLSPKFRLDASRGKRCVGGRVSSHTDAFVSRRVRDLACLQQFQLAWISVIGNSVGIETMPAQVYREYRCHMRLCAVEGSLTSINISLRLTEYRTSSSGLPDLANTDPSLSVCGQARLQMLLTVRWSLELVGVC